MADDLLAPEVVEAADPWRELFWQVAAELGCLPSTFVDGNEHVLRAARALAAAQPAQGREVERRTRVAIRTVTPQGTSAILNLMIGEDPDKAAEWHRAYSVAGTEIEVVEITEIVRRREPTDAG